MVEANSSSTGPENVQPAPANVPSAGPAAPRATQDWLPPPEREAYKPLSLLALVGFIPAALYAVMILVGALIALFSRSPWLLPNWTFLIPVVAVLICWIARSQIQKSEGVQAGLALTTWGIGLCLFFGLTYAAYSGATYVAIREQAKSFAQGWMQQLQEGRIERAFLLMLPAGDDRPAEDAQLGHNLQQLNRPSPKGGLGPFSTFSQMELVRLLQDGGSQTEVQFQGVGAWQYERGGYRVRLRYHITTPILSFDARVTVQSTEPAKGESGARSWYVVHGETTLLKETMVPREQGERLFEQIGMAAEAAHSWVSQFEAEGTDHLPSYLGTLPSSERQRLLAAEHETETLVPATGPAPLAASLPLNLRKGLQAFQNGNWIRVSPQFWAQNEDTKKKMSRMARDLCSLKRGEFGLTVQPSIFPLIKQEGENGLQLSFDVRLIYQPEDGSRPYFLEGFLVLENLTPDVVRKDAWRVKALELTTVHRAPAAPQRT